MTDQHTPGPLGTFDVGERHHCQWCGNDLDLTADLLAALESLAESTEWVIKENGWPSVGTTLAMRLNQAKIIARKARGKDA